jgi:5-methylcytosine-specific restriction protein A
LLNWQRKTETDLIGARQNFIRHEIEAGTGAAIGMAVDDSGTRTALRLWFDDLQERNGPVVELKPYGLKGYRARLAFGRFAGELVRKIQSASDEDIRLARALVASIGPEIEIDFGGQTPQDWKVNSGAFTITATARGLPANTETAISIVCANVIVPLMGAMAELIGYDAIEETAAQENEMEGSVLRSVVKRRERNPRNRLLCIRLHGERCVCCGITPKEIYGSAGSIIEVHHIEPLSLLGAPRPYDPAIDLVPVCPNCHRALHTRRPVPLTLEELHSVLNGRRLSGEVE